MNTISVHNPAESDDCLFCVEHMDEAALGILEPEDKQRFQCHLASCPLCRSQLNTLDDVLQHLPLACTQVSPADDLRARLHQRFAEEVTAVYEPVAPSVTPVRAPSPARRMRRPVWSIGSVFAGVCVALAVIGLWNLLPFDTDPSINPRGNVRVYAIQTTCDDCDDATGGHIGADLDDNDGTVMAWNLDPNATHEVWCVEHNGDKEMVGELNVADSGSVVQTLSFPEAVGEYQQIYVARDDGTQELSVTPSREDASDELTSPESSPAAD